MENTAIKLLRGDCMDSVEMEAKIEAGIKRLGIETIIVAIKEYCRSKDDKHKKSIIKDLKGPWMNLLTDGMSASYADKLLKNEQEIKARLNVKVESEEEDE